MHPDGSSPLPELDQEQSAPPLLGRYRLQSEIPTEGRCRLYRARATGVAHETDVAIKTLGRVPSERSGRARLLQEARVGLNFRGPHLIRVLEVHADPTLFLVMEHVEGASLRELLALSPTRDVARYVIPVLVDVLDALFTLHNWRNEEGIPSFIVHQAPSLRHMLVGVDGVARLIDMSHARGPLLGGPIDADPTLRHSELAPEQVTAPGSVDPRSDLFIVGLALWEALTGAPLSASPQRETLAAGAEAPAPLELSKAGAHPSSICFDAFCQRALAPLRHDRFWSAAEMASALRKTARAAGQWAGRAELAAWVRDTLDLRAAETTKAPAPARPRLCVPPPPPANPRETVMPTPSVTSEPSGAAPPPIDLRKTMVAGTFALPRLPTWRSSSPAHFSARDEARPSSTPTEARDSALDPGRVTYQTTVTRLRRAAPHALVVALLTGAVATALRFHETRLASADALPASAPAAASLSPAHTRPVVTQLLETTVVERPQTPAPTGDRELERARHHRNRSVRSAVDRPDPFIPELPANPY